MSTRSIASSSINGGAEVNLSGYLTEASASATYALIIPFQSSPPSSPYDGQVWIDSDTNMLYVYSSSASSFVLVSGEQEESKAFSLFTSGM